jgi:hypothetical protein
MEKKIITWITDEATDVELLELVNSINSWNGELEDYRFFYMDELDDLFYGIKPTELLSKLADDFDKDAEGFKDTIYGLESCNVEDIADDIRCNAEEVAESTINNMDNIDLPESLEEYLEEEE